MSDSIYNNAGMPSGQGAAPQSNLMVRCHDCGGTQIWKRTSASEIEVYHDCLSGKHSRECFAALTLERDTLKAEIKEWKHSLESVALMAGMEASESWGTLDILTHVREMREANAALKAKVERLSAPVSDAENFHFEDDELLGALTGSEYLSMRVRHMLSGHTSGEKWSLYRAIAKLAFAARASTPPPRPINDDEQRRKDAGWNDRPKARCVCGEMIAWYSGEYLHVASRSKSCADGRLASPAHFLVGMPPAEPEWEKGA